MVLPRHTRPKLFHDITSEWELSRELVETETCSDLPFLCRAMEKKRRMLTSNGNNGCTCSSSGSQDGTWNLTPPKFRRLSGTKSIKSARFAALGAMDDKPCRTRSSGALGSFPNTDDSHDGNGNQGVVHVSEQLRTRCMRWSRHCRDTSGDRV